MQLKAYSIRDSKAEVFNTPFFSKTHGEAERNFQQLTKDSNSMVNKYPEDYDLYHLGTYDDSTGTFEALDTPQHMVKAISLIKPTLQS